jgi:hypothetical protein
MARIKQVTLYRYDELSDTAKAHARDWYREREREQGGPEDFACVIEDAETILGILGIELRYHDTKLMGGGTRRDPNIWWQVGYMQSDGAVFEGTYSYAKGAHKKIRAHAPQDEELHRIADGLLEIQKRHRYQVTATIKSGQGFWPEVETYLDDMAADDYKGVRDLIRDLCRWIYDALRAEDESRQEDSYVDERLRDGDYEFTADGEIDT